MLNTEQVRWSDTWMLLYYLDLSTVCKVIPICIYPLFMGVSLFMNIFIWIYPMFTDVNLNLFSVYGCFSSDSILCLWGVSDLDLSNIFGRLLYSWFMAHFWFFPSSPVFSSCILCSWMMWNIMAHCLLYVHFTIN